MATETKLEWKTGPITEEGEYLLEGYENERYGLDLIFAGRHFRLPVTAWGISEGRRWAKVTQPQKMVKKRIWSNVPSVEASLTIWLNEEEAVFARPEGWITICCAWEEPENP